MEELQSANLLKDHHNNNLFDGGYRFTIKKKELSIFTTINDDKAGKYFVNSYKFVENIPTCTSEVINGICIGKEFVTKYILDDNTAKAIPKPPRNTD